MRIFNLDPLGFILLSRRGLVVGSASLALSQNADITSLVRIRWTALYVHFAVSLVLKTVSNFTPAECLYSIGDRTPIWFRRFAIRPMEKPSLYMEKIICTYSLTASSTMSWFLFSGDFM